MKRTIRQGCFETNSSSMHSIVLTNIPGESKKGEIYIWKGNHEFNVWDRDICFERSPFQILSTMICKIYFAIASYVDDDEKIEEIRDIVREIFGCEMKLPMRTVEEYRRADDHSRVYYGEYEWKEDIEDPTKEVVIYKPDPSVELEYREYQVIDGYIDHQSAGLLQHFLEKNNISLRDFITKAKYIVVIDGDEYCEFDKILESGIVDLSKIIERFPKDSSFDWVKWKEEHPDEEDD